MQRLSNQLARLVRSDTLLVAADFDGTLAPIVDDPASARADPKALAALQTLADMHHTYAAIISGRSLADLGSLVGDVGRIHLIGSHGAECSIGPAIAASSAGMKALQTAEQFMRELAARTPGIIIEKKPTSCAFHYRQANETLAALAVDQLLAAASHWPLHPRRGKKVVEFSAIPADKGSALTSLRQRLGRNNALYVGDDLTDEDVFKTLGSEDVSIKVGSGPTVAKYHLRNPRAVAGLLEELARRREARESISE